MKNEIREKFTKIKGDIHVGQFHEGGVFSDSEFLIGHTHARETDTKNYTKAQIKALFLISGDNLDCDMGSIDNCTECDNSSDPTSNINECIGTKPNPKSKDHLKEENAKIEFVSIKCSEE